MIGDSIVRVNLGDGVVKFICGVVILVVRFLVCISISCVYFKELFFKGRFLVENMVCVFNWRFDKLM